MKTGFCIGRKYFLTIIIILITLLFPLTTFAGGDIFIKNGTVLTVSNGIIENGSILIHGGKITNIGKGIIPPAGIKVIDAKGMYVMPGIVDSHCHIGIGGNINENTRAVTSEVRVEDVIRHDDISIYRALAGGVTSVLTLHGSANVIGGQNAVLKLKFGKPAEELLIKGKGGIKFALGENPKRKGQSRHSSYPDGRMGIAHIIRKSFIEAQEYMKKWEDYRQKKADGKIVMPPRKDFRLEAIADVLRGKLKVHCHCYRADEIEMLLNLCEEFGVKILSLEHCLEGYRVADEIVKHGAIPSIFIDFWGYKMEAFDASPYNVKLLYEKGAKVSINSDSNERIRRLYHEAAKAVKYGVPEEEALKMITLHSAEILDIADRIGSLEIGKDGDIAIFSGHPFSVYSKCVKTIIEGEIYFDRNTVKTTEKILKLSGTIPADSKKGDAR